MANGKVVLGSAYKPLIQRVIQECIPLGYSIDVKNNPQQSSRVNMETLIRGILDMQKMQRLRININRRDTSDSYE